MRRTAVLPILVAVVVACTRPPAEPRTIEIGDQRVRTDGGPDVPDPPDDEDAGEGFGPRDPCAAVDVVFAIDDSGPGMVEEQAALKDAVLPLFTARLSEHGAALGLWRIGVTDACPTPAGLHRGGDNGDCGLPEGARWVDADVTDATTLVRCLADVQAGANDCSGEDDDEQPASSAATALSPPTIDSSNAGFLRDDALLVVVVMTDEDELPSPSASMADLHARLLATKGGDPRSVVFTGIGGATACEGPVGVVGDAHKLRELVGYFDADARGQFWDTCGGGPTLEERVDGLVGMIDDSCDRFGE